MPLHEVEIILENTTDNQRMSKATIVSVITDTNRPHSEDEPIFLIAPDENGIDFFLSLGTILKHDLKIPNPVYIHEGEGDLISPDVPNKDRLKYSSELLAEEIIAKLTKCANLTPCLLLATSWKSFEVFLAANYIANKGFKPPVLYIVNGMTPEDASIFFDTSNNKLAILEIYNFLNHTTKLCSLSTIDFIEHSIEKKLFGLPKFGYIMDTIKNIILRENKGAKLENINKFKKFTQIAHNNINNLLNYQNQSNFKSACNLYLLITKGLHNEFQDKQFFGWDKYVKSMVNITEENLTNINYENLFDENYNFKLAKSIIRNFDPLLFQIQNISSKLFSRRNTLNPDQVWVDSVKTALLDFVRKIDDLSSAKIKNVEPNESSSSTNSLPKSESSTSFYSDWTLIEEREIHSQTMKINNSTPTSNQSSPKSSSSISLTSSGEHDSNEKNRKNLLFSPLSNPSSPSSNPSSPLSLSLQSSNDYPVGSSDKNSPSDTLKPTFSPLTKKMKAMTKFFSLRSDPLSPSSIESDPENQESNSSINSTSSSCDSLKTTHQIFSFSPRGMNSPASPSSFQQDQLTTPENSSDLNNLSATFESTNNKM